MFSAVALGAEIYSSVRLPDAHLAKALERTMASQSLMHGKWGIDRPPTGDAVSMHVFWSYMVLLLPVLAAVTLIVIFRWQARRTRSADQRLEWLQTDALLPLNRNRNCFECLHPVPLEALTGCLKARARCSG